MKAALYATTGAAADVLRVEEIDRPQPGPGEVLVRVRASGLNPTDYKSRSGMTPRPIDGFQIPHQDGAGIIEAVGPGVDPGPRGGAGLAVARRGRAALGDGGRVDRPARQAGRSAARRRLVRAGCHARRARHDRAL